MASENDDVFAKLPLDIIILQILTKLPAISLIQLRCVSGPFNSVISHLRFIILHLVYCESNFSFLSEHTFSLCKTLEGFCACSIPAFAGYLTLWNPSIGRFKIVPSVLELSCVGIHFSHMGVGFGFDRKFDDFRVDQEFYPKKVVDGGRILASMNYTKLVLVDVENDEVKDLEVCGYPSSFYGDNYVPSLALLGN